MYARSGKGTQGRLEIQREFKFNIIQISPIALDLQNNLMSSFKEKHNPAMPHQNVE